MGKVIQYIGVLIAMCGIICMESLLIGFALLITGTTVCYLGTEVERVRQLRHLGGTRCGTRS